VSKRHLPEYSERQATRNAERAPACFCGERTCAADPAYWMAFTLCGIRGAVAADDEEMDCLRCEAAWVAGRRTFDEVEEFDVYRPRLPFAYARALRILRDRHREEFDALEADAR
jgi:hypothetical protein